VAVQNKLKQFQKKETRIVLYRDMSLMLAMFFLPLGYDALFKLMMEVTGSYWGADIVFYSISASFWLSYILLTRHLTKKNIQ
jgi:hypothetical protein